MWFVLSACGFGSKSSISGEGNEESGKVLLEVYANASNAAAFPISGVCEPGSYVMVTATDGVATVTLDEPVACEKGSFATTIDIASLADRLTIRVDAVRADGTLIRTLFERSVTKDVIPPTISLADAAKASIVQANAGAYTVFGACSEAGRAVIVRLRDGTGADLRASPDAVCDPDASPAWSATVDASTLAEGVISIVVSHSDVAGNTSTTTLPVDKDVAGPTAPTSPVWAQTSPSPYATVTATWVASDSSDVVAQSLQMYKGAACAAALGAPVPITDVGQMTFVFDGAAGEEYSFTVASVDPAGNLGVSVCSPTMAILSTVSEGATALAWTETSPVTAAAVNMKWTHAPTGVVKQTVRVYSDGVCGTEITAIDVPSVSDQTLAYTLPGNGTYSFRVMSVGPGGIVPSICSPAMTGHLTAPSVTINGLPNGGASKLLTFTVTLTAPTLSHYRVKWGVVASTDCTSAAGYGGEAAAATSVSLDVTALAEGDLRFCALGKDAYGRWQPLAAASSVTWTKDTVAPAATLDNVPAGNDATAVLSVEVTNADADYYKYKVGADATTDCSVGAGYSVATAVTTLINANLNPLPEGVVELCVVAGDDADNWQAYAAATTATWTKDTLAPSASLVGTPGVRSNALALAVTVAGTDVTQYRYKLGTAAATTCSDPTGYGAALPATDAIEDDLTGFADVALRLCVIGGDGSNNWQSATTAASAGWTKDLSAPAASVGGAPGAYDLANALSIAVGGTDVSHYRHKLGTQAAVDCASPAGYGAETPISTLIQDSLSALTDGTYRVCVIGRDLAGNYQTFASAVVVDWTRDATPPTSAGAASSFALLANNSTTARAVWASTGSDALSGVAGQQIHLFDDGVACTGTAAKVVNVAPGLTQYDWAHFADTTLRGLVRFFIRTIDNAGGGTNSACSGSHYVHNGLVSFHGTSNGQMMGYQVTYHDITGDGVNEVILYGPMSDYRGSLAIIPGGYPLWSKTARIYTGELANDYFGSSLQFKDLDLDGIDDLVATMNSASPGGVSNAGSIYVIKGASSLPASGAISTVGKRYDGDVVQGGLGGSLQLVDVNNDGYPDFLSQGATARPGGLTNAGALYVILGGATLPSSGTISSVGKRYDGEATGDRVGGSGIALRDLNGDGFVEIISAYTSALPGGVTNAGSIYIVPGGATLPNSGPISTAGRRYNGTETGDRVGTFAYQDLNGDGLAEMISFTQNAAPGGKTGAGSVWVLDFASGFPASGSITTAGREYEGTQAGDAFGFGSIAEINSMVDVTGDGLKDIVVSYSGAQPGALANAGSIYVIPMATTLPASGTVAALGLRYNGDTANDQAVLNLVADVTGDGVADLVVSAWGDDPGARTDAGSIYVLFGGALPASGALNTVAQRKYEGAHAGSLAMVNKTLDIDSDGTTEMYGAYSTASPSGRSGAGSIVILPIGVGRLPASGIFGTVGWYYEGDVAGDSFGSSISMFDLTGDGKKELLVMSPGADPGAKSNAGSLWVFDFASGFPASGLAATVGRRYDGEFASDNFTSSACTGCDFNRDGYGDFWSNNPSASPTGKAGAGSYYVILGGQALPASGPISTAGRRYDGDAASDSLNLETTYAVDIDNSGGIDLVGYTATSLVVIPDVDVSLPASGAIGTVALKYVNSTPTNFCHYVTKIIDLSGDGVPDILGGHYTATNGAFTDAGSICMLQGGSLPAAGNLSSWSPRIFLGTANMDYLGIGNGYADIDSDGLSDLVMSSQSESRILFGRSDLSTAQPVTVTSTTWTTEPGVQPSSFGLKDVTGDGLMDVVFQGSNASTGGLTTNGALYVIPFEFIPNDK